MFKLVLLVAIVVASQAMPEMVGGWTSQTVIDDHVMDLARWTSSQLSGYTGVQGEHNVMTVRNVQTQVVSGINYKFTLDVLIHTADNHYSFRSCDVQLYEESWTNTRVLSSAKCAAHPNFPDF